MSIWFAMMIGFLAQPDPDLLVIEGPRFPDTLKRVYEADCGYQTSEITIQKSKGHAVSIGPILINGSSNASQEDIDAIQQLFSPFDRLHLFSASCWSNGSKYQFSVYSRTTREGGIVEISIDEAGELEYFYMSVPQDE